MILLYFFRIASFQDFPQNHAARSIHREDDWRRVMVGSISLYNAEGECPHTLYTAQSPEYGKEMTHDTIPYSLSIRCHSKIDDYLC
jgi:hypothetical protein